MSLNESQVVPVYRDPTALPLGKRGTPLFDLAVFQLDASVVIGYGSELEWQTGPEYRGDPKVWGWDGAPMLCGTGDTHVDAYERVAV